MKGMCQTCGATAPLEWFLNEPIARQVLATALKLPQAVQDQLLGYLTLFRPTGGSMQPKKALRLVQEIAGLVAPGSIQVKGQVARPCPPRIWAQAMEQMGERPPTLELPIKNHKYLLKVAWGIADKDDARAEAGRNQRELVGNHRQTGDDEPVGLSQLERAILAKNGGAPHPTLSPAGARVLKRMED